MNHARDDINISRKVIQQYTLMLNLVANYIRSAGFEVLIAVQLMIQVFRDVMLSLGKRFMTV